MRSRFAAKGICRNNHLIPLQLSLRKNVGFHRPWSAPRSPRTINEFLASKWLTHNRCRRVCDFLCFYVFVAINRLSTTKSTTPALITYFSREKSAEPDDFERPPIVLTAETLSQHLLILVFRDVSIKSIPARNRPNRTISSGPQRSFRRPPAGLQPPSLSRSVSPTRLLCNGLSVAKSLGNTSV